MKNRIIYHNKDLDGFCSGAIVKRFLLERDQTDIEMIGWNYGDPSPIAYDFNDGRYYIVDLSLDVEDMRKLYLDGNAIWIDHHKSAIELSKIEGYDDMAGVRYDGDSASLLTWKFLYPSEERIVTVPLCVYYVDRYDVWKKGQDWDTVMEAQMGMRLHLGDPAIKENFDEWMYYLEPGMGFNTILNDGQTILKYQEQQYAIAAKSAFDLEFEGLKFCAINASGGSNTVKSVVREDHDAILTFMFNGKDWTVGMYGNNKDHDLSKIAVKWGGGGHANACGFKVNNIYKVFAGF